MKFLALLVAALAPLALADGADDDVTTTCTSTSTMTKTITISRVQTTSVYGNGTAPTTKASGGAVLPTTTGGLKTVPTGAASSLDSARVAVAGVAGMIVVAFM
jgi:hypothetical protein